MTDVQWDFVLVTGEMNVFAESERNQTDRKDGLLVVHDRYRVWIKTWAEIIESAKHRLKFVQQAMDFAPSAEDALLYLRETHEKYLPEDLRQQSGTPQ